MMRISDDDDDDMMLMKITDVDDENNNADNIYDHADNYDSTMMTALQLVSSSLTPSAVDHHC